MKKILLLLAFVTYLFSCKDTATSTQRTNDDDTLTAADWAKYPEYQSAYVIAMQKYYFDSIPKTNLNIIGVVSFDDPPVRSFLRNKQRMLIIVGAYKKDTLGVLKGSRALIVGFKDKGKFAYYDFNTLFPKSALGKAGGDVCPLPEPPCSIEGSSQ